MHKKECAHVPELYVHMLLLHHWELINTWLLGDNNVGSATIYCVYKCVCVCGPVPIAVTLAQSFNIPANQRVDFFSSIYVNVRWRRAATDGGVFVSQPPPEASVIDKVWINE